MGWLSCSHPAARLAVQTDEVTVKPSKQDPAEYQVVTFHLWCMKCDQPVDISCLRLKPEIKAREDAEFLRVMSGLRRNEEAP